MGSLQSGAAGLAAALTAFGADSPVGADLTEALSRLHITSREELLTEAILHQLRDGATLSDGALEPAIQAEPLRARIRKCRHDCALFADKQQDYDDFRPSYPAEAVAHIRQLVGDGAVIADVGSGTGKLAALLAGFAGKVYAIEPNVHMRRVLTARTAALPNVEPLSATAEATRMPDHSVDAITVAEAYHWFDNDQTRAEFRRILKPGGHVSCCGTASSVASTTMKCTPSSRDTASSPGPTSAPAMIARTISTALAPGRNSPLTTPCTKPSSNSTAACAAPPTRRKPVPSPASPIAQPFKRCLRSTR